MRCLGQGHIGSAAASFSSSSGNRSTGSAARISMNRAFFFASLTPKLNFGCKVAVRVVVPIMTGKAHLGASANSMLFHTYTRCADEDCRLLSHTRILSAKWRDECEEVLTGNASFARSLQKRNFQILLAQASACSRHVVSCCLVA